MSRNICVYSHDADPAQDSHLYRISRDDAAYRLQAGYCTYLSPTSVQLKPPPNYTPDRTSAIAGGMFQSAWHVRPSANYLVWQMRSEE